MDIRERIFYRKGPFSGTYYKVDLDLGEIEALGDYEDKKTISEIEPNDRVIKEISQFEKISSSRYTQIYEFIIHLITDKKSDESHEPVSTPNH